MQTLREETERKGGGNFFPIPFFSIAEFSASLPFPWANRVVPNCNLFEPSGGRDKKAAGRRLAFVRLPKAPTGFLFPDIPLKF